jgi:Lipoate-protein ligase B
MDRAIAAVRNGKIPNVALFFHYPPVYTVGRGKKPENYKNVEVVEVDRGGDVTYHGPGQLICYPIIDLRINWM